MGFHGENFHKLLTHTAYCPPSLQIIVEKPYAERQKTAKFTKISPLKDTHYMV